MSNLNKPRPFVEIPEHKLLCQYYKDLADVISVDSFARPRWFWEDGGLCYNLIAWSGAVSSRADYLSDKQFRLFEALGLITVVPFGTFSGPNLYNLDGARVAHIIKFSQERSWQELYALNLEQRTTLNFFQQLRKHLIQYFHWIRRN